MTKTENFFNILLKTVAEAFFYLRRGQTNVKDSIGYVSCYRIKKILQKIRKEKQEKVRAKSLATKDLFNKKEA